MFVEPRSLRYFCRLAGGVPANSSLMTLCRRMPRILLRGLVLTTVALPWRGRESHSGCRAKPPTGQLTTIWAGGWWPEWTSDVGGLLAEGACRRSGLHHGAGGGPHAAGHQFTAAMMQSGG
jgi:hypothetical protein